MLCHLADPIVGHKPHCRPHAAASHRHLAGTVLRYVERLDLDTLAVDDRQPFSDLSHAVMQSLDSRLNLTELRLNVVDVPSMSGWGLAALVAVMLVVMAIALGLTSGSRPAARP